ncbi:MAG: DUF1559 domain-containing protein [Verrucomicrobia bacterium]|nr:DUF1559 domain-containing protein [Verrucomicrobiota bacterium]
MIIGVFLAVLIPGLNGARESARRAACSSNLRILGLGMAQYEGNSGGVLPWRTGASRPDEAWRDLGTLFPKYVSDPEAFVCLSLRDSRSRLKKAFHARESEVEPLTADDARALISYSYSHDARGGIWGGQQSAHVPWTTDADWAARLLADKKAGVAMVKGFGHRWRGESVGRNVLHRGLYVKWKVGERAVDPDEESDAIGAPGAPDYRAWWSDPPYSGE